MQVELPYERHVEMDALVDGLETARTRENKLLIRGPEARLRERYPQAFRAVDERRRGLIEQAAERLEQIAEPEDFFSAALVQDLKQALVDGTT